MNELDGDWRVERLDGFLPPMIGVRKRIHGDHGETRIGPLPGWPFRVERQERFVALIYRLPFQTLVDELRPLTCGSWLGRSTLGGRELGWFRMSRRGYNDTRSEEVGSMTREGKLSRKLVEYVQNIHAMEQNVLLMLDSMIVTTRDAEIVALLRQHKEETRRHERLLHERLKALGGFGLTSAGKDIAAIASAQAKGLADLWRADKVSRNARDAYVTEHLEIAAYELLERLAERAGDPETAEVARTNRAEEEAMAEKIVSNWDRFLDLALSEQGILV